MLDPRRTSIIRVGRIGLPWLKTVLTLCHAKLGLPDRGRAIKGLFLCNSWDFSAFGLLQRVALRCYQPSLELIIRFMFI